MNADVKEMWIQALESGRYQQTKGQLRAGDTYCCLGVLCDISKLGNWYQFGSDFIYKVDDVPYSTILPKEVAEWADTYAAGDLSAEPGDTLMHLNDNGYTFEQIAQVIKERL